jgi:hypothetical protein
MTHRARMKHHHPFEAQPPPSFLNVVSSFYPQPCLHLGAQGLKARQVIAQGKALGTAFHYYQSPARAAQTGWVQGCSRQIKPIQGNSSPPNFWPKEHHACSPLRMANPSRAFLYFCANLRHLRTSQVTHFDLRKPLKRTERDRKGHKRTLKKKIW